MCWAVFGGGFWATSLPIPEAPRAAERRCAQHVSQVHCVVERQFLPKDWIMEQWDAGYYITAIAGSIDASSLVVMSKGARFSQQSYKVSEALPYEWIRKKWREVRRRAAAALRVQLMCSPVVGKTPQAWFLSRAWLYCSSVGEVCHGPAACIHTTACSCGLVLAHALRSAGGRP